MRVGFPNVVRVRSVWRKRVTDAATGTRTGDPIRACLPPGKPRFITGSTTALLSEISRCP